MPYARVSRTQKISNRCNHYRDFPPGGGNSIAAMEQPRMFLASVSRRSREGED